MKVSIRKTAFLILYFLYNNFCVYSQIPILWGMTSFGGATGGGVIFKINGDGTGFSLKHSFVSPTGINPYSNFIQASNGKMYATICNWGANQKGALCSFDPATNIFTDVHDFNYINGGYPSGSLIQLANGMIYGLAERGGVDSNGVIFSFNPANNAYTDVHDFYWPDGDVPRGGLIQAGNGLLYGMTSTGGSGSDGIIFSFDPASNTFTNLFNFGGSNGSTPIGDLMEASNGKLYGMTYNGGPINGGVLFSFDLSNNAYVKLIDFTGTNGKNPCGTLIQISNGLLYGLTRYGGTNNAGVLFTYDIFNSSYNVLLNFNGTNGDRPSGSFSQGTDGKLYAMTQYGGANNKGVIFSFDPLINFQSVVFSFNTSNGEFPTGNGFIEQVTTGLNTTAAADQLATISPNPFSNELHLNVFNNQYSKVIMYDITNRKIFEKELEDCDLINTEQLSKGVYIYEVRNKNGVIKKGKVVKD